MCYNRLIQYTILDIIQYTILDMEVTNETDTCSR